ncbi:helix-turn-helix domain-containing protein [Sphingobacterium spiritivorum]|uniref:helix-turn-helix domain-containing protein n=1 Tax=Sphingobacterium spiritivorum TaxID=258 RepID=UPI003DA3EA33
MQNDIKCGLLEQKQGELSDTISKQAYVWYEKDWKHDDYEHIHSRAQLLYVEEGYQYVHLEKNIYLLPQNHVMWIPSSISHRTTSEAQTVNLMTVLYHEKQTEAFYKDIHVFAAPVILKEMLMYAQKWSQQTAPDQEEEAFLNALLTSLPYFCKEADSLQIPIPSDTRLLPVCAYINMHFHEQVQIQQLSDIAHLSVRTLERIFKQETGITVQKYIQLIRIIKSIEWSDSGKYTLKQIAHMVGYKSAAAFSSSYLAIMKKRPGTKK